MSTPRDRGPERPPESFSSLVGTLVAGKYRIKRLLGRGGMGSVYKAENVSIGRTVALKILHTHLADDGTTLARFQREARIAASAGHEHVVEVLDMGRAGPKRTLSDEITALETDDKIEAELAALKKRLGK